MAFQWLVRTRAALEDASAVEGRNEEGGRGGRLGRQFVGHAVEARGRTGAGSCMGSSASDEKEDVGELGWSWVR